MLPTFLAMRLVVGGMSYLAPGLSARLFAFDPDGNPQGAYWARLFGVRDVVLAVAAARTSGAARRQVIQLTAACDAADVVTTLLGRRAGYLPRSAALLSTGLAVTAGVVAAAAAAEVEQT